MGCTGHCAAVHQNNAVVLATRWVEANFVVTYERVAAQAIGSQIRFQVMPINARATDGERRSTVVSFFAIDRAKRQAAGDAVQAVVVVHEAIAHIQNRPWWIG